ncbi:ABC transporter permease [Agrobacterium sp. Ap1]|uniref:ABC transporter permease n=1 Tax=Agrobacterium sp. Ap1 TaxID=2815337 RepID=UPI001A8C67D3|nr:ABC transporter permease [Agrobacterium sp. Ap1]MBO0141242.1 ABC transporter permease [Agrobacterium sp. Ap1]
MNAVIMRDIRSRFFNHGLGFLIPPLMPVAHALILLTIYTFTSRTAVFGEDLLLFFATGLVPALTFTYISRFMAVSIVANKGMLSFPAVHLLDIVLSRSFLEMVSIMISIVVMFVILLSVGSDPYPAFPAQALIAMVFTAILAIGVGIVASVISSIIPIFSMIYSISMALVYVTSGGPIYLHTAPEKVLYLCSFNPVFHAVAWMRSAYYIGYPTQYFSETYLIAWCLLSVTVGLLLERYLKKFVLNA